jgi:ketosteroid isomerase-like protein
MERRGFLRFCLTAGVVQSITPSISAAQASSATAVPSQSRTLSEADAQAIRDTVIKLEDAMNLAVDSLDCDVGMASFGDQEPIFVSSGRVTRTRTAMRGVCETMVAPRSGAVFVVDTLTAHALSSDAAYVVREGTYTVNFKDGTSRRTFLVMTTVWARQSGGWKMVHLHESSRVPPA